MSNISRSLEDFVPQDVRVLRVHTNLVPGYVTSRWSPKIPWAADKTYALAACSVEVRNYGAETAALVLQEADTDDSSGVRTKIGTAIRVVPGGTVTAAFTPKKQFVEIKGIVGNGPISAEVQTKMDWMCVGFNHKLDAQYPSSGWATDPVEAKSAEQEFESNTEWVVVHNLGFEAVPTLFNTTGTDITALATISGQSTTGYTATFSTAKAGTAYSTK